jgi:flavoprotein
MSFAADPTSGRIAIDVGTGVGPDMVSVYHISDTKNQQRSFHMKRVVAAVAVTLMSAGIALAADSITLNAKNGNVTFNHKKHQELVANCKTCHEKGPGKIEGFGKDWAHKNCKGCHADKGTGPTKCAECHKK